MFPLPPAPPTAAPPAGRLSAPGEKARARRIADSARRRAQRDSAAVAAAAPPPSQAHAWDAFYLLNRDSFFKDRHLLRAALPELMPAAVRADPARHIPKLTFGGADANKDADAGVEVGGGAATCADDADVVFVEAGCGVGNALFPVLRANPRAYGYAFDFSAEAVALLRASPEYHASRAHAFVADLAKPAGYRAEIGMQAHFVVCIFSLSALPPDQMPAAVAGLAALLRRGGTLLLRDYAEGDMRMGKFARRDEAARLDGSRGGRVEEEEAERAPRLFRRGDKTWAYFFRRDEVAELMAGAGLECVECEFEERRVENRKDATVMHRQWIVGRFRKPDAA